MNGASAEPSASTSKPPSPHTITITGVSQIFLRTRRNFHRSLTRSIIKSSEFFGHRGLLPAGRRSGEPIARPVRLETKPQGILASGTQNHSDRSKHTEKHDTHDEWIENSKELQRQPSPSPVEGAQQRCGEQRDRDKGRCSNR